VGFEFAELFMFVLAVLFGKVSGLLDSK